METVYYHLNARRIAVGELASGGEACRYAFIPQKKARPLPPAADNVLDFRAYRAKLAPACPDLPDDPETPEAPETAAPSRPARRPADRFGLVDLALEVCATAAIVVFAAIASLQFLQIL